MEAGQVGADGTLATGLVALALSNVLEAAQIRLHRMVGRVVLEQRERNYPVTNILVLVRSYTALKLIKRSEKEFFLFHQNNLLI